jgi:hypothetical protein
MGWNDTAQNPITGEVGPRCPSQPTQPDIDCRPALAYGTWECGLPSGHQGWPDVIGDQDASQYQDHSWSQTAGG